jgi:hypothetical protein
VVGWGLLQVHRCFWVLVAGFVALAVATASKGALVAEAPGVAVMMETGFDSWAGVLLSGHPASSQGVRATPRVSDDGCCCTVDIECPLVHSGLALVCPSLAPFWRDLGVPPAPSVLGKGIAPPPTLRPPRASV